MRGRRWVLVAVGIGAAFVVPTPAAANGGAYIEFDRTHYLPGETAVGELRRSRPAPLSVDESARTEVAEAAQR
jgi:hypothetical protein